MKELTFKEVIANIKEGEVWESVAEDILKIIERKGDCVYFNFDSKDMCVNLKYSLYTLKRKKYTFEEAFKAYEEGKEIESVKYRYKKIEGRDCWYCESDGFWDIESNGFNIDISEIRNKWYIND